MPSWLTPGPVLLRKFIRTSKHDDLVEEVQLTHINPNYAHVHYKNGRESTVSLSDLAPCPINTTEASAELHQEMHEPSTEFNGVQPPPSNTNDLVVDNGSNDVTVTINNNEKFQNVPSDNTESVTQPLRRSLRTKKEPNRYGFEDD